MAEQKRAVLYGRVSTKRQEDNNSLPSQFAAMRKYAERNNFVIIDEISDTFTGNSSLADRPGGAKVYGYLKRKAIDVVILYTIDRVARDEEGLEYGWTYARVIRTAGDLNCWRR